MDVRVKKALMGNEEIFDMPKYVIEGIGTWLPRYEEGKKDKIQEHTLSQEKALYKNHIGPFFKGRKLADVTVEDVRAFEKHLQRKGLSAKTVSNCLTSLKRFFAYAEEQEWIRHTPFDSTYILPDAKPARRRQAETRTCKGCTRPGRRCWKRWLVIWKRWLVMTGTKSKKKNNGKREKK